jgi:hypothetical protein
METSSYFFIRILNALAGRYNMKITFEELAKMIDLSTNISKSDDDIYADRENQAQLLDALLLLDYEGLIFLNSYTDDSTITIKGLIKINSTVYWN